MARTPPSSVLRTTAPPPAAAPPGRACGPPCPAAAGSPRPFPPPLYHRPVYSGAQLPRFDLPIEPPGTPFQRQAWRAMRDIPYGQTMTYGQLAARLGKPGAGRAVGAANGRNPVFIMVPCHRLVGADGRLRGHGIGITHKQFLLHLEQRAAGARS